MTATPNKISLRSYQVGFGDCFLLSVGYSDDTERHILIDFGTMGLLTSLHTSKAAWMKKVADDIADRCDNKLNIVVATHRHADHISGFSTKDGLASGDVIRALKPDLVIQPWTEDPGIARDAENRLNPLAASDTALVDAGEVERSSSQMFAATLNNMHAVSRSIFDEARNLGDAGKFKHTIGQSLQEQIEFIADDNIANEPAVKNLASMGRNIYINYGYDLNAELKDILPEVKVTVLGPPTIEQHKDVKGKAVDDPEFWMFQAMNKNFWGMQSATSQLTGKLITGEANLFPDADSETESVPSHDRWFVRRLREIRAAQLLGLVRILDDSMNNTSLILMFEIGGYKLLFPGDAQIENWEYALKFAPQKEANLQLLKDTDLYKVGHHGSRNATPITLWKTFGNKKKPMDDGQRVLKSVMSTMGDENGHFKHGKRSNHSEVPRDTLVEDLKNFTEYHTTQTTNTAEKFYDDIVIEL
jgi:hypothetical protein